MDEVADLGAEEEEEEVDGLSADDDSGVWWETVPETVRRMDGGLKEAADTRGRQCQRQFRLCTYEQMG